MDEAIQSIDGLLQAIETPADETGALAAIARWLEPFHPSLIFLGTGQLSVLAVEARGAAAGRIEPKELLESIAGRLEDDEFCLFQTGENLPLDTAFGVRLPIDDRELILGGVVGEGADAFFRSNASRQTLVHYGVIAWTAIKHYSEKQIALTENRHLRAEHSTLRLAHLQSTVDLVHEREHRLAAEAEQLATEQFLQAAEKSSKSKSEFLANISHEIRTPMTAILGFAEELAETVQDPESRGAVSIITRNGQHLLEIINDVLDISKIEAGGLQVERIVCSPTEILSEVVLLMRKRAEAKGLELIVEFDGTPPETVVTDPTRVRQILINLVGNAIKFTEKGEVRIRSELLAEPSESPRLRFEVIDTGIGMTEEQVESLFQPFSQGDLATTRRYGGTGLGLAISKRLAEMLGGDIDIQSALGVGSRFVVTVDASPDPGGDHGSRDFPRRVLIQSKKSLSVEALAEKNLRILLVEDCPDNQRLISLILRKMGARVEIASDGREALDWLLPEAAEHTADPFDLILMDIELPILNGVDVTRQLRAEGVQTPVIALSAHATADHVRTAGEAGCDLYLTKPVDRQKLLDAVCECVRR